MALIIEYINKNDIKPYENNAKMHTDAQIKQIKKSIEQFGFNDPIALWKDNEIIEGHGRLLAVMQMDNIVNVPVIRLDGLTDNQRKAYMLAHNKLTMNTGFDIDMLNLELDSIIDLDMSDFGFELNDKSENQSKDLSDAFKETFEIIITCENETEQENLYMKLQEEGYQCRISTL